MKELISCSNVPKRIKSINFGLLSPQAMSELSELEVCNRELYSVVGGPTGSKPLPFGCLDRRLGISDKNSSCETCGLKLAECSGHFGHIKLALPVFHIGYFKAIISILQCICKGCSRILLSPMEKLQWLRKLRNPNLDSLQRDFLYKSIIGICKKVSVCQYCRCQNGMVKKVGALKIIHEKGRKKASLDHSAFSAAVEGMPEARQLLTRVATFGIEELSPLKVISLFEKMLPEDCELVGIPPSCNGRPDLLLWRVLLVPPACIRPSLEQETGSNEDDLTVKLGEIIYTNLILEDALAKGSPISMIMEDWDFLQLQCALYIHSELPGVSGSAQVTSKPIRGFCQRLKGKAGRFRGNLSGKRVDFSGRTVISPDPTLAIGEVGIPIYMAKLLTYPETVTTFNVDRLRELIKSGPDIHPGANFVITGSNILNQGDCSRMIVNDRGSVATATLPFKRFLRFGDREKISRELKTGDVVERHLCDGDIVLFNRQPSLHKLSIMAHRARVRPWRTLRFNECQCAPYNADFDGDEMNIHLPQTEESRAEACELMGVQSNLVTPRNGQPVIAGTQDFITAAYLISSKDVFMDRILFSQTVSSMFDSNLHIDLPMPSILKPKMLWTGKQVFDVLMRPNISCKMMVNLEARNRSFIRSSDPTRPPEFCPADGYVIIRNSKMISGTMDKSIIGDGSKSTSLFYVLLRDYGSSFAADAMLRLAKLASRWLTNRGFSIGLNDVQPSEKLRLEKEILVEKGYADCNAYIEQFKIGKLANQPGCTPSQSLEAVISGVLSKIRDDVGQICIEELSSNNAPLIMQWCGSKGSKINVSQMVACVGQQIISGSRIPDGFTDRTLPHFLPKEKTPAAKGFVKNSFCSGLTPTEFFFHAISGREGLVDTAVKTAETGYMQRRLMKALEDLSTQYDLSVRSSSGSIVQFCYGDDGLDPASMEGDDVPVNLLRNLIHAKSLYPIGWNKSLSSAEMSYEVNRLLKELQIDAKCTSVFCASLVSFLKKNCIDPFSMIEYLSMEPENKAQICGISIQQLEYFLKTCLNKYQKARIEPGTAVGALGAQSIGEPGTQMTLKTFHFAGVASMNVTLGVPRIKEIINASKNISTPIITASLVSAHDQLAARIIKGRIETTRLGDIAEHIEEIYGPMEAYLRIRLSLDTIRALQLEVDIFQIQQSLCRAPKLKLSESQILVEPPDLLRIYLPSSTKITSNGKEKDENVFLKLQRLKRSLPSVVILGIPSVQRAVINDCNDGRFNLLVEGYGLLEVMSTEGVIGSKTTSNHIIEIAKVLGIEAARTTIASEIQYTMSKHGMTIDARHVALLADTMTCKGEILGITRFGIAKMKDSVLMLASFEKTTDHLFDAAVKGKRDDILGVSECIIMGAPMPIGTGLFKLLQKIVVGIPEDEINDQIEMNQIQRQRVDGDDEMFSFIDQEKCPLMEIVEPLDEEMFRKKDSSQMPLHMQPSSISSLILAKKPLLFDQIQFHPLSKTVS